MTRKQEILANVLAWIAIAIVTFVFVNESLNILANQGHNMKLAYHYKNDKHGWHHVMTAPIDDLNANWHSGDKWAYEFMLEQGTQVLIMGFNMWQLVNDNEVTE